MNTTTTTYSIYNIQKTNKNKNLIYITVKPRIFPWEIINKIYLLQFDFVWGLYNEIDKNILMSALSTEVKENSTYIVGNEPFLHTLEYLGKRNNSYHLIWIIDSKIYDKKRIEVLLGSEFQIEKNKSIFNARKDVSIITANDNIELIDNDYQLTIKEILHVEKEYCLFYKEKEHLSKINLNQNNLLNQYAIPKMIKSHEFIIRYSSLIAFQNKYLKYFSNKFYLFKYLLGIYQYQTFKKILTTCFSNVENILTIMACHFTDKIEEHTLAFLKELQKYSAKIKLIYSGSSNITLDNLANIEISKIPNKGYDCGKWYVGLVNEDLKMFDRFLLVNDSIYNLRNLEDIFSYVQGKTTEMIGMIDSYEIKYHVQSHFRFYNYNGIKKVIPLLQNFYHSTLPVDLLRQNIINTFEVNTTLWNSFDSYYCIDDVNYESNIHFDQKKLNEKIKQENYPINKVKNKYK